MIQQTILTWLTAICILSAASSVLSAQNSSEDVLQPLQLAPSDLSGNDLQQMKLKNEPTREFYQKQLYRGEDLSVYVVSSQSWPGTMENFSIDEYVYIFNGKARARPTGGDDIYFYSGEHFTIPKGYTGDWEVMAGTNLHYELSVISTPRAPEAKVSKQLLPQLLDKDKLAGLSVDLSQDGLFEETLFMGDELRISIRGERPRAVDLSAPQQEKMIAVLSGQLTLQSPDAQKHDFYSGDFLVIPKGYRGSWTSKGHGMLKYIVVEKAVGNQ